MLRSLISTRLLYALEGLVFAGELPQNALELPIEVSDTKSADHGDYACNYALTASKKLGMPPRSICEKLKVALETANDVFENVEIAGPGFLNIRFKAEVIAQCVKAVLDGSFLRREMPSKGRINVEFVSVNPNGPITIGSGRGAAFGDALCRVLEAAGYEPYREYYINDGVNSQQMRLFAQSVKFHYLTLVGLPDDPNSFPADGYKGSYVVDVAQSIRDLFGDHQENQPVDWFQAQSQRLMIARQDSDLTQFRVHFDHWQSEQELHNAGKVEGALVRLEERGTAYRSPISLAPVSENAEPGKPSKASDEDDDEDGQGDGGDALWLRSSAFGDDKDRVLVRADGRPAYIAADVAYLEDKFDRGFDCLKLILGPDHHGYVQRMYAASEAIGHTVGKDGEFEIVIYQVVRFVKDGQPARMRKRDGNIYELRDLIAELGQDAAPNAEPAEKARIGADVARFFFLMRSHETHMDFDIDLATKQSDENPVFYAQYAHARICSVISKGNEAGLKPQPNFDTGLLKHPKELELIKKILDLPFEIQRCAVDYGVHRLTTYAVELGRLFHHFYDACRVVQPNEIQLSEARLAVCDAARIGLSSTFNMLGISAPTRMDRQREVAEETG